MPKSFLVAAALVTVLVIFAIIFTKSKDPQINPVGTWSDKGISLPLRLTHKPSNALHAHFDAIYVICIPSRWDHMKRLMKRWGIAATMWPAYLKSTMNREDLVQEGFLHPKAEVSSGRICCHYSHLAVLKDFLASEHKTCLVFEDDLADSYRNADECNTAVGPYLANLPTTWNYVNFGACWEFCNFATSANGFWSQAHTPRCRHAIGFSREGAEICVKQTQPMTQRSGDTMLAMLLLTQSLPHGYTTTKTLFAQNRETFGTSLGNFDNVNRQCSKIGSKFSM